MPFLASHKMIRAESKKCGWEVSWMMRPEKQRGSDHLLLISLSYSYPIDCEIYLAYGLHGKDARYRCTISWLRFMSQTEIVTHIPAKQREICDSQQVR